MGAAAHPDAVRAVAVELGIEHRIVAGLARRVQGRRVLGLDIDEPVPRPVVVHQQDRQRRGGGRGLVAVDAEGVRRAVFRPHHIVVRRAVGHGVIQIARGIARRADRRVRTAGGVAAEDRVAVAVLRHRQRAGQLGIDGCTLVDDRYGLEAGRGRQWLVGLPGLVRLERQALRIAGIGDDCLVEPVTVISSYDQVAPGAHQGVMEYRADARPPAVGQRV